MLPKTSKKWKELFSTVYELRVARKIQKKIFYSILPFESNKSLKMNACVFADVYYCLWKIKFRSIQKKKYGSKSVSIDQILHTLYAHVSQSFSVLIIFSNFSGDDDEFFFLVKIVFFYRSGYNITLWLIFESNFIDAWRNINKTEFH